MDVYMKNLRYSSTSFLVSLEYIMVQIHLIACDYSLKFHLSELPKLPYSIAGSSKGF